MEISLGGLFESNTKSVISNKPSLHFQTLHISLQILNICYAVGLVKYKIPVLQKNSKVKNGTTIMEDPLAHVHKEI